MILTSIPLSHIDAQLAADRVGQALAVTANKALLGNAGKAGKAGSLLVQGTGADVVVRAAVEVVNLLDRPVKK